MSNASRHTWAALATGLICLVGTSSYLLYYDFSYSQVATTMGVIVSWSSLAVAIIRIYHLEKTSDKIEEEVKYTKENIVR